jgi:hypothetical protein
MIVTYIYAMYKVQWVFYHVVVNYLVQVITTLIDGGLEIYYLLWASGKDCGWINRYNYFYYVLEGFSSMLIQYFQFLIIWGEYINIYCNWG